MASAFLTIAPVLLVLCLSGYGRGLLILLDRKREVPPDIFESAFYGIFLVTAGAITANFFVALGTKPGSLVLVTGLVLFSILEWPSRFQWKQVLLLAVLVAIVCWAEGRIVFHHDTGLYHMPSMNWVAYQPAPFGLGNVESRLGFDSAWLLFQSAFRVEALLEWGHLAIIVTAFQALVVAWTANKLLTEIRTKGWDARAMAYFAAIIVMLAFISEYHRTSTDISPNLLTICAWVSFCKLALSDERELHSSGASEFSLLLVFVTLAITFKLSILPIALLPVLVLVLRGRKDSYFLLCSQLRTGAVLSVYFAAWLARNFVLTGCAIYPLDATCAPVDWGVGKETATREAAVVTGWARHPGKGHLDYAPFLNFTWLGSWFERHKFSFEFRTTLAAVVFFLISLGVVRRPARRNTSAIRFMWASAGFAVAGLAFWFLKAPNPRFSWSFFAILAATLVVAGLYRFNYRIPIGFAPLAIYSIILAIVAMLKLPDTHPTMLKAPVPPAEQVTFSNNWKVYIPTSDKLCWSLFPCAPYGFGGKSVEERCGRLFFTRKTPGAS